MRQNKILSFNLKERFCKDKQLSIQIFHEPYFKERLILHTKLKKYENILNEYINFENMIFEEFHGQEQNFFEAIEIIKQSAIELCFENKHFIEFKSKAELNNNKENPLGINSTDIFKKHNENKLLLSIDMNGANFQILRRYNKDLVFNCINYKEFIVYIIKQKNLKYSDRFIHYFSKSKYLRQYIFGKLESSKQQFLQNVLTNDIVNYLYCNKVFKTEQFIYKSHDEIVLNLDNFDITKLQMIQEEIIMNFYVDIRFELFKIKDIDNNNYVKLDIHNIPLELKGVNKLFFPQVIKRLFNEPISENDKVFLYENKILSKFLNEYDK